MAGTMCPSFMATRDEKDSTRGRANALRDVLARGTLDRPDLASKDVYDVLDLCLSCKACKTECPSSVDMAKIKTEFLAHYQAEHGASLRSRVFGHIHDLSRLASPVAPFANLGMRLGLDAPVKNALGVAPQRRLSPFAARTFTDRWRAHQRRPGGSPRQTRGKVVYFHDTFAEYNYPRIGMAAVTLLEAAGFEVIVEKRRVCCGRPLLSKGFVEEARKLAQRNIELLAPYAQQGMPIVGTEPSCILTLRAEYRDLLPDDEDVVAVARESYMVDEFLAKLDQAGDLGIVWKDGPGPDVLFHGHCHQKALIGMGPSMAMLATAGCTARESGAGCCGMAGSFGYEAEHYEVSRKIGEERLFPAIAAATSSTTVSVSGVSCRQQIEHFTDRRTKHIAEVLAERIAPAMPGRSALRYRCPPRWSPRRSRWRTPGTLVPVPPSAPVLTLAAIAGEYHHLSIMEHRVAEPNGPNSKSRRILVVEDEPSIAGFVRRGLHFEGYDVDVVPDGPGALLRLRDSPPDLLVLDVMVPGVDGFEIARRLRAAEAAERCPRSRS